MAIRVICGDGSYVMIAPAFFDKLPLFQNPRMAPEGTYRLRCEASLETLNNLLQKVYNETSPVAITEENYDELRDLCLELGYTGIDRELRAFNAETRNELKRQVVSLTSRLSRHDRLLAEVHQQLGELLREKRRGESEIPDIIAQTMEHYGQEFDDDLRRREEQSAIRFNDLSDRMTALAESARGHEEKIRALEAQPKQFVFGGRNPLDGVIAYLKRKYGQDVGRRGMVVVTASSVRDDSDACRPENTIDFGSPVGFTSKNERNSWICYDFGYRRVIPTSYSLRSIDAPPGSCHPKSWVLEGSNDESHWTEIHGFDSKGRSLYRDSYYRDKDKRAVESDSLNRNLAAANFPVCHCRGEAFKLIRLRQTSWNWAGNHTLALDSFELYGIVSEG